MQEMQTDIWRYLGRARLVITTNGSVARDGRGIAGRGVTRQAAERFPELLAELGLLLQEAGNHVHELSHGLVSFPVEDTPWSLPDLRLISRSAAELRSLADRQGWPLVLVPRPGCGGGGLAWETVRPILAEQFDDRFIVVTAPDEHL